MKVIQAGLILTHFSGKFDSLRYASFFERLTDNKTMRQ